MTIPRALLVVGAIYIIILYMAVPAGGLGGTIIIQPPDRNQTILPVQPQPLPQPSPGHPDPIRILESAKARGDHKQALEALKLMALEPWKYEGFRTTITVTISPNFTAKTWAWINAHYRDNVYYMVPDLNGNVWVVGHGMRPRTINVTFQVEIGSYCIVLNANSGGLIAPPIAQSGQIEGTPGSTVTWYIYNNTNSQYWTQYNFTNTFQVEAGWIPQGNPTPSCTNPYLSSFQYSLRYSWTITPQAWTTTYSGYPAFQTQVQLPSTTQPQTFFWIVHGEYYDSNGTLQPFHYIVYYGNLTNTDPTQETNSLLGAILDILRNIANTILGALQEFFNWLIDQLNNLLPDQVKQFLQFLYDIAMTVYNIMVGIVDNMGMILPFIQLSIYLIPGVIVALLLHNPLKIVDLISWIIALVQRIVTAIRAILPLP